MSVHVHPRGCPGDCCNYDAYVDDLATGEPFDTDYTPPMGRGVHRFLSSQRGSNARPVRERRVASPMIGRAGHTIGLDDRPARPTSSRSVAAPPSAAANPAPRRSAPGSLLVTAGSGPSSPLPVSEVSHDEVRRRGGHRDGA